MTLPAGRSVGRPLAATAHRGVQRVRGANATMMLTVYLVLLIGIPSNLSISALGAYGRPQLLWGLLLLLWWLFTRLQRFLDVGHHGTQPIRVALGAFVVVVLLGFARAMMAGQPADQVSPAVSALIRLASWCGVVLVALDGVRTMTEVMTLARRIVLACSLLAVLGIAQFLTGQPLIDFLNSVPGFTGSAGGIDARGMFVRSSGTATHPLEYGTALSVAVPLAIALAVWRRGPTIPAQRRWWLAVAVIALASLLAVSRSALIGLALSLAFVIPALPKAYRILVVAGGAVLASAAVVLVPGLFGTVLGMFTAVGDDPSSVSRQVGIAMAPAFMAPSPLLGVGFGTWLPRYYIFDNMWLGIAVETGILGAIALMALFLAAAGSAVGAGRMSASEDLVLFGRAFAASVLTAGVLFAFFDGFSFPIAAGLAFLLIGLCGSMRTVGFAAGKTGEIGQVDDGDVRGVDARPAHDHISAHEPAAATP